MRRSLFFAGSVGVISWAALVACSDGPNDARGPRADGGSDASFLDDAAPPDPDVEAPRGDVCGDAGGLQPGAPWPLRGGCVTRAGASSLRGPQTGAVRWIAPAHAAESSPAVAADARVWVGTAEGDVLALNPAGDVVAGYRTGGPVRSSPAIDARGVVVVGSSDGTLYGLANADPPPLDVDGGADEDAEAPLYPPAKVVFALPVGAPVDSSPVIAGDGTIYVATTDGALAAVTADGSAVKWRAAIAGGSSPALGQDGTIYVGGSDRKLHAVSPDGATRWARDLGSEVGASPVVGGDGTVYVGAADGTLHAIDAAGQARWAYATGGPITSSPAVRGEVVYVGSGDKKLHAIATADGAAKWTFETLGAVASPVIGDDGTVYVGAADARLYAVTPKGTLFFAVNVKGKVEGAPAVASGPVLYVTTDTGVAAVGP